MFQLDVNITNENDTNCRYEQPNSGNVTEQNVLNFVKLAFKHYPISRVLIGGGEPLKVWNTVQLIIDYIIGFNTLKYKSSVLKDKRISFDIETNGLLLPNNFDCIKYVMQNPCIRLFIRTDGTRLANSLRISPTENKLQNAKLLYDVVPGNLVPKLVAHMTITEFTIPYFHENIDFLYEQGYKNIYISSVHGLSKNDRLYREVEQLHNELLEKKRNVNLKVLNSSLPVYRSCMKYYIDNVYIGQVQSTEKDKFPAGVTESGNKKIEQIQYSGDDLYHTKLFNMV